MSIEPEPAEGAEEHELTWAEVYRVSTCGGCRKPDCPTCVQRFLNYLRDNGTDRARDAKGLG